MGSKQSKNGGPTKLRKVGIRLLKCFVLILCIISWHNSAVGLKNYVFSDDPEIAYFISFVIQGIVAVISLQYHNIIDAYAEFNTRPDGGNGAQNPKTAKQFKKQRPPIRERLKKFRKRWINLVSFIAVVAFGVSIWFDFVYMGNSTYKTTEDDDVVSDITDPFAEIRIEIFGWLTNSLNTSREDVYVKIKEVFNDTPEIGTAGYEKTWGKYWEDELDKYDTEKLKKNINADISYVASAYGAHRNGKPNEALMTLEDVNGFKDAYAKYDVNAYMKQIIEAATVSKPEMLNSDAIDRIINLMDDVRNHLSALIQLEKGTISSESELKPTAKKKPETLNSEVIARITNLMNKIRLPFSVLIQLGKLSNEFGDSSSYAGNEEIFSQLKAAEEAKVKKINNKKKWEYQLADGTAVLYSELSELRIRQCKEAIADIDEYKLYVENIKTDARYNAALIISMLSEAKTIDMKDIDIITANIGRAMFAEVDGSLSTKIGHFNELRLSLAEYVPLKNVDYILRNLQFGEGKGRAAYIKNQIDSLIQNLSSISNSSLKDDVSSSITKLVALEDVYLNEKNPMIKAYNHFIDRNKEYKKRIGAEGDVNPSQSTNGLAFAALVFAILIDCTSLFLGNIVQKWERSDEDDSQN